MPSPHFSFNARLGLRQQIAAPPAAARMISRGRRIRRGAARRPRGRRDRYAARAASIRRSHRDASARYGARPSRSTERLKGRTVSGSGVCSSLCAHDCVHVLALVCLTTTTAMVLRSYRLPVRARVLALCSAAALVGALLNRWERLTTSIEDVQTKVPAYTPRTFCVWSLFWFLH